jgi:hypothetical protein
MRIVSGVMTVFLGIFICTTFGLVRLGKVSRETILYYVSIKDPEL